MTPLVVRFASLGGRSVTFDLDAVAAAAALPQRTLRQTLQYVSAVERSVVLGRFTLDELLDLPHETRAAAMTEFAQAQRRATMSRTRSAARAPRFFSSAPDFRPCSRWDSIARSSSAIP